jgi:hypothetical protein
MNGHVRLKKAITKLAALKLDGATVADHWQARDLYEQSSVEHPDNVCGQYADMAEELIARIQIRNALEERANG